MSIKWCEAQGDTLECSNDNGWDLAIDVCEDDKNIYVSMNLPGIKPDEIDIEAEGNYLRISGTREQEKENKGKDYYSKEIKRGSFERIVTLPSSVDVDKSKAEIKDGVLNITLPKIAGKNPEKIKVESK